MFKVVFYQINGKVNAIFDVNLGIGFDSGGGLS